MNNKVKFNICNCHYALQQTQENGEVTFGAPVAMPGAVSIALDIIMQSLIQRTGIIEKCAFAV